MLDHDQFQSAVAAAKQHFDLIRKKHPDLKAYLVMSLPGGQTGIDSSPAQMLGEFHAMVVDDAAKTRALEILSRLEVLEWEAKTKSETERPVKQMEHLRKHLAQCARQFRYDEKCQVEFRFDVLNGGINYDLIWKLQADDLVARDHTPQTKASIRIVLGTLARFVEQSQAI